MVWGRVHRAVEECLNANGVLQNSKRSFHWWDSRVQIFWPGVKIKWVNDGGREDKVRVDRKVIRWRPPVGGVD